MFCTWAGALYLVRSRLPHALTSMTCILQAPSHSTQSQTVFLFQPGVTYSPPAQATSAGLSPGLVTGFMNHNLRVSHNNPFASESSSSEFPLLLAKPVAKRAVAEVAQHDKVPRPVGFVPPPPPPCPGKIRYFKI